MRFVIVCLSSWLSRSIPTPETIWLAVMLNDEVSESDICINHPPRPVRDLHTWSWWWWCIVQTLSRTTRQTHDTSSQDALFMDSTLLTGYNLQVTWLASHFVIISLSKDHHLLGRILHPLKEFLTHCKIQSHWFSTQSVSVPDLVTYQSHVTRPHQLRSYQTDQHQHNTSLAWLTITI